MSFARYFQDELDHLRRAGNAFAQEFPQLTKYLSSRSTDPDVERLLEGFAFLTARLREKIDDQLPEVTQLLLMLLWPNFLRPIPAMCIVEYAPVPGAIADLQKVEKGAEVLSTPVDGTVCRFRLATDVEILPLKIDTVRHERSHAGSAITISVSTLADEAISAIGLRKLRFYCAGSPYSAQSLSLWLQRYLRRASVSVGGTQYDLGSGCVKPVGYASEDAVLPYPHNAFAGYRLLQEFFTFPEKFAFFDLVFPMQASLPMSSARADIVLEFDRPLPPDVRVDKESFKLHCAPAINLFDHDAEPILLNNKRNDYPVVPASRDSSDVEVFSIDEVTGWRPSTDGRPGYSQRYDRFENFSHEIERAEGRDVVYFREKVRQQIAGTRLDRFLSFVREDETHVFRQHEIIAVRLSCSNGAVPTHLGYGDIDKPGRNLPAFVKPANITRPSAPCYPMVDGALHWQLISSLALNYRSLQDPVALRNILMTFDFPARSDAQKERTARNRLEGMEGISSVPIDRLLAGLPVRGMRSVLRMRESKFASDGEMFLFASVLAEFFALYATVNSFHELVVQGIEKGEEYRWQARIGNQPLI
ncbi:MAG: type VI secretion system baseplate subunit TssF [Rhizobiaceae bacterium]|nr:type VI secretion system baseplate subunit TssF [Rhizobiaceae bacterium]